MTDKQIREHSRKKAREQHYVHAKRHLSLHAVQSRIEVCSTSIANAEAEIAEHRLAIENITSDMQDVQDTLAGLKRAAAEKR